jgi:RNA polymerase sigma-70 factor (ECF subfamily)
MDESDLMAVLGRCLEGGASAQWEIFIRLAQPTIASGVLRVLSGRSIFNRELADDLIQDTFVRLCGNDFRSLRSFRGNEANSLRAYLKTIAANIAYDHLKSLPPAPIVAIDQVPEQKHSENKTHRETESRMRLELIEKCLSGVDPARKRVFWLYHREGMKPREIARLPGLGMGMSGVETLVYVLTKNVQDCLRKAGVLD